jgi:hypothetical protein
VAARSPPCTCHMVARTELRRWLWGYQRLPLLTPEQAAEGDQLCRSVFTSTATRCSQESDLLALWEDARPPIWVDPMLDELAASLVVSRSAGTPALGRPSTPTAASLEVQALMADTCSPPRMIQLSFADAKALRVDGDDRPPTSMPTSPLALAREFARRISASQKTPILKAPP